MNQRTALYQRHLDAGGRMIDFAGWDMPLNYGSQLSEHMQVRRHAGVFDVSHMTIIDIAGRDSREFLRFLLSNDVARLDRPGKAQYSAMLNEAGGVVDDLLVYHLHGGFRLVVNCATRRKDLEWLEQHSAAFDLEIVERPHHAILAVHGPESIDRVCELLPAAQAAEVATLGNFRALELSELFVARTGYTGEKGLELMMPEAEAVALWDRLMAAGVMPVGLGARDTLRLEAGMNLYGHEMDEHTSPMAANMAQAIAWEPSDRNFLGREAVSVHRQEQVEGRLPVLAGVVLEDRGILRAGQKIITERGEGTLTSGGFSPVLKHAIALARIPAGSVSCQIDIRGRLTPGRIVKPVFVRFGEKVFE